MQGQLNLVQLLQGKRLTRAHRRIAQILVSHTNEIGYMSSTDLARLSEVSQPSMSRFAAALGFSGFAEMRNYFRELAKGGAEEPSPHLKHNKYTAALDAEVQNLSNLSPAFSNVDQIQAAGKILALSNPLPVLGLRASIGLAHQFVYYAAKIHDNVRLIANGGSLIEDELEQCRDAGANCLMAIALPLYPRETIAAINYAKGLGLEIVVITDGAFRRDHHDADYVFAGNLYSGLAFDACSSAAVMVSFLLDAMCDFIPDSERRLQARDRSSRRRKVFERS